MMAISRTGWIDSARGIGIILVVVGHVIPSIGFYPISKLIFIFHMPLFVFLSALLMKDQGWRETSAGKFKGLLIPYLAYLSLLGIPYLLFSFATSMHSAAVFGLRLILGGTFLFGAFGAFWYVPAIYIALVCYSYLVGRFGGPASKSFILVICGLFALSFAISISRPEFPVPYSLHAVPALVCLIWVGRMVPWKAPPPAFTVSAVLMMALVVAAHFRGADPRFAFNLKEGMIGFPLMGIALAVAGTQCVFVLARLAELSRPAADVLGYVGKITMPILFLHQAVHFSLTGHLFFHRGFGDKVLISFISLAVPIVFAWVLHRLAPRACPYFGIPMLTTKAIVPASEGTAKA